MFDISANFSYSRQKDSSRGLDRVDLGVREWRWESTYEAIVELQEKYNETERN